MHLDLIPKASFKYKQQLLSNFLYNSPLHFLILVTAKFTKNNMPEEKSSFKTQQKLPFNLTHLFKKIERQENETEIK